MSANADTRSYQSTGFLAFLGTWAASLTTMVASADPHVRAWGAAGLVVLPVVYLVCSTLIKRAKLRAKLRAASPSNFLSLGRPPAALPAAPPADPGAPR